MTGWALAIDFGTSNTVAALRWPDGRRATALFDGSPLLPSAVFAQPDGALLTGRDAVHSARLASERFEPNPKLRVDEGSVLLGREVPVADLFAAVLGRVAAEAGRMAGGRPDTVVLTHPAGWGGPRRAVLERAAEAAGLAPVVLLPEPVAAARHLLAEHPPPQPAGRSAPVVIYDLGAGTLDVSVVSAGEVLVSDGLPDAGGLDIDAALLAHLSAALAGRDPVAWDRLRSPKTAADLRGRRQLLDDVRTAKEMLSRTAQAFVYVPFLDDDAPVNREQLEAIAEPLIARTVTATRATLSRAGLGLPLAGPLYLVGGASRMPLVGTHLHRRLKVAPTVTEQPELAVALGALLDVPDAAAPHPRAPAPAPPAEPAAPGDDYDHRLLARAERMARSVADPEFRAVALTHVAAALAGIDQRHAGLLIAEAERDARLGTRARRWRAFALARMAAALHPVGHPGVEPMIRHAEELARGVRGRQARSEAMEDVVSALAVIDPLRAEDMAWDIPNPPQLEIALGEVIEKVAPVDPDLAEELLDELADPYWRACGFASVAAAVVATDPERAWQAVARAEEAARSMSGVWSGDRCTVLAALAGVLAPSDGARAERLADEAIHITREFPDAGDRAVWLARVARGLVAVYPRRAADIATMVSQIRPSAGEDETGLLPFALAYVAVVLAGLDPIGAERLTEDAERAARADVTEATAFLRARAASKIADIVRARRPAR